MMLLHVRARGAAVFRQALEDGRVLAVDGQQACSHAACTVCMEQRTAHHQSLLVGQEQALARPRAAKQGARPAALTMAPMTVIRHLQRCYLFKSICALQYLGCKAICLDFFGQLSRACRHLP